MRGTVSRPLLPGTFQKWETEWVCFVLPRNFPFLKQALRTHSPLSFIAVLPGPHFSVAQAGQCQRGWANLTSPSSAFSLQNSISQRDQILWLDRKPVRGISAWWGPRWKMKGKFNATTPITTKGGSSGNSKRGSFPFGKGLGGKAPRGKGCGQDAPRVLWGSLTQGEGPRKRTIFPFSFPP